MFENENVSGIYCGEFGEWFWSMLHNFSPTLYSDLDRNGLDRIPLKGRVPQRHVHSSPAIGDISLRLCHISQSLIHRNESFTARNWGPNWGHMVFLLLCVVLFTGNCSQCIDLFKCCWWFS
jgi:hypothetical protein